MKSLFNLQKTSAEAQSTSEIRVAIESDYSEVVVAFAEVLAELEEAAKGVIK